MIAYLKGKGYKITGPPKEVKDEYTFENIWNLYQKKIGCKDKLKKIWNSMSFKDRKAATEFVPIYVLSQPDKKYRKNFQTFLNQRGWEDEIIGVIPAVPCQPKATEISSLIEQTKRMMRESRGEVKENELRKRILGMIDLCNKDPHSSAKGQLLAFYRNGTISSLGINWNPNTAL